MAGNLEKAQPRSRQRPGARLGVRRDTKPCTCDVQRWKNADRNCSFDVGWEDMIQRMPVKSCCSEVCALQKPITYCTSASQRSTQCPCSCLLQKEMGNHEGLQTSHWRHSRPRGQGYSWGTVAMDDPRWGRDMTVAMGDPCRAGSSVRDCSCGWPVLGQGCPWGTVATGRAQQSRDTPQSEFI